MSSVFSTPSVPRLPPLPVMAETPSSALPTGVDPVAARMREERKQRLSQGVRSTILTSPMGLPGALNRNAPGSTLLGS